VSAGDGRDFDAEVGLVVDEGDLERARHFFVGVARGGPGGATAEGV
jgi:hypothetical protein